MCFPNPPARNFNVVIALITATTAAIVTLCMASRKS